VTKDCINKLVLNGETNRLEVIRVDFSGQVCGTGNVQTEATPLRYQGAYRQVQGCPLKLTTRFEVFSEASAGRTATPPHAAREERRGWARVVYCLLQAPRG